MEQITFEGRIDRYNGVTVDSKEEPCEPDQLVNRLKEIPFRIYLYLHILQFKQASKQKKLLTSTTWCPASILERQSHSRHSGYHPRLHHHLPTESLQKWKLENKRCVWFKVSIKDAAWVPILANDGFNFHHSRDDFVMMYKCLPETKSNLPPSCHTNVGVGGIVLNERNELLVVTEKHSEIKHWKLPGGYVERGEDIKDAAIREVKEETGIDSVFQSMVTLRHSHNSMFGNSDIYVVVLLRATSDSITKSDMEIAACKWMNIDEYLNHPNVIDFNRFIVNQAIDLDRKKLKLDLIKGTIQLPSYKRDYTSLVVNDM